MIYLVKLQNYIQNAWQYLTSKNKVSGPFTTRNEEGLGLLRTLMFMGAKSEFPFTFSYNSKVYGYSAFLKKAREIPETKTKVGDLLTLQEVADIVGTSRTTVCRIIDRSSVETVSVGSRRMLREKQIPRIKRLIKPQGNPVCYNREKMRKQSIAMLKARWGNG